MWSGAVLSAQQTSNTDYEYIINLYFFFLCWSFLIVFLINLRDFSATAHTSVEEE